MKRLFLILVLLGVAFAGISIDEYTLTKSVYKPGEPGVATIKVSNPAGSERVTSITMSVTPSYELAVTSSPKLADIDAGGSAIVSIPFKVKENTSPGIYTIYAQFTGYKSTTATGGASQISVNSVSVPVTVVNEPELSFSVDKKLLTGLDDVTLNIVNNGGIANNVKITVPGTVSLYGADNVYVGTIEDEASVPLSLDSRSSEDGAEDVNLVISYEDALGISHTDNATIRMTVRNERLDVTFMQQSEITTRSESALTLEATNDGTGAISDLRLTFLNDSLKLVDTNEIKFGDLAPGQTVTKSVNIYTDISPGLTLANSRVEWIEEDVQMEESRTVPVTITSDADVAVFLEAKPLPLSTGGEHTISVLVSNLGTFSIENVDVEISSPVLRSLDISDKQYIGGLQRDDFSTVQFLMLVNATDPGTYPVYLDINYRDESGEWKSKSITQDIKVYDGLPDEQGSPLPLLGLLGVVVVAVWYFKFRKK